MLPLTASKGIAVVSGNSLTIYGQTNSTGQLTAIATHISDAGIGGGESNDSATTNPCGKITINGGIVYAIGGSDAAGIGAGQRGGAEIVINGGVITAQGGNNGAGIGGGWASSSIIVEINGGTVTATGGTYNRIQFV